MYASLDIFIFFFRYPRCAIRSCDTWVQWGVRTGLPYLLLWALVRGAWRNVSSLGSCPWRVLTAPLDATSVSGPGVVLQDHVILLGDFLGVYSVSWAQKGRLLW